MVMKRADAIDLRSVGSFKRCIEKTLLISAAVPTHAWVRVEIGDPKRAVAYSKSVLTIAQHVSFHSHTGPNFAGSWQTASSWLAVLPRIGSHVIDGICFTLSSSEISVEMSGLP